VRSTSHGSSYGGTVVALEVTVPLSVALIGDAAILTRVAALKFGPKRGHCDTRRWHSWRTCSCQRVSCCRQSRVMWRVDGGDDELVDVMVPLLRC
jgi:hypothetical protein